MTTTDLEEAFYLSYFTFFSHAHWKGSMMIKGLKWADYLQFLWPLLKSLYFFYCVSTSCPCTCMRLHLQNHDFLQRLKKNGYKRTVLASVEGISSRLSCWVWIVSHMQLVIFGLFPAPRFLVSYFFYIQKALDIAKSIFFLTWIEWKYQI